MGEGKSRQAIAPKDFLTKLAHADEALNHIFSPLMRDQIRRSQYTQDKLGRNW